MALPSSRASLPPVLPGTGGLGESDHELKVQLRHTMFPPAQEPSALSEDLGLEADSRLGNFDLNQMCQFHCFGIVGGASFKWPKGPVC